MLDNRKIIWDSECEMKDTYAVTASAEASVDAVAKIFDTGGGYTEGKLKINVTACAAVGEYFISLQGAASSTFATPFVELANIQFAALASSRGSRAVAAGYYELNWSNDFAATVYRYLRIYTTVTGTSSTNTITYIAQIAKK